MPLAQPKPYTRRKSSHSPFHVVPQSSLLDRTRTRYSMHIFWKSLSQLGIWNLGSFPLSAFSLIISSHYLNKNPSIKLDSISLYPLITTRLCSQSQHRQHEADYFLHGQILHLHLTCVHPPLPRLCNDPLPSWSKEESRCSYPSWSCPHRAW